MWYHGRCKKERQPTPVEKWRVDHACCVNGLQLLLNSGCVSHLCGTGLPMLPVQEMCVSPVLKWSANAASSGCEHVQCRYAKLQDQVAQQTYQVATSQKSLQQAQDQVSQSWPLDPH